MATTVRTFKNFIGGEWVEAASGETFETTSPANGETLGVFPRSGVEDVDRAAPGGHPPIVQLAQIKR